MNRVLHAAGATVLFLSLTTTAGAQMRDRGFRGSGSQSAFRPVPGLGFDYSHLAAVSGNYTFGNSFHDDQGQALITPVFLGGYPFIAPAPQQPQVIVVQVPAPVVVVQQPAPVSHGPATSPKASTVQAPPAVEAAPPRDVSPFVLVRRDGKTLLAAAYSVIGTNLRYITPQGISRTLPLAELDAVATRRTNQDRGATFSL